ncbi:MAG: hypothetical protein ACKPBA_07295 [Planctomycetota bacterium]
MRQTELIIFIVVLAINGGIALWKKAKERDAARAAAKASADAALATVKAPAKATRAAAPAAPTAPRRAQVAVAKKRVGQTPAMRATPSPATPSPAKPRVQPVPPSPAKPSPVKPRLQPALVAPAATPVAAAVPGARGAVALATGPLGLRQAIAAAEILGPPRSLRPYGAAPGA